MTEQQYWPKWGKILLNPETVTEHFLVTGMTGSGKTKIINILMNSVLPNSKGRGTKAVVYDPKQDVVSYLFGMGLGDRIRLLHPFDKRGRAWNMAQDIDSPVSARQLATILVPEGKNSQASESFFTDAVRDLLYGVLLSFIKCVPNPGTWTFRDVVLAMLYEPYLNFILGQNKTREGRPFPITGRIFSSYLDTQGDYRTVSNIRASINARLSVFEPIAAVWHRATNTLDGLGRPLTFSLSEWMGSEDILVLGNDEASRAAVDAINQALFKRMTEMILSAPELPSGWAGELRGLTWVFLDEVREAGVLDGLSRLLTKGRTKGACVVLGFQDIEGLRDVYGENVANELTAQCSHVIVLRLSSPKTAEWASGLFGEVLVRTRERSRQMGQEGGPSMGTSERDEVRPGILDSEFLNLPRPNLKSGITGIFKDSSLSAGDDCKLTLAAGQVDDASPRASREPDEANYIPRDVEDQYLLPWDHSDWTRLGFTGAPPSLGPDASTGPVNLAGISVEKL